MLTAVRQPIPAAQTASDLPRCGCRKMKNITVLVDGMNVAFDEDGTMRYIAMKVVNMDEEHRWQEVSSYFYVCII